VDVKIVRIEKKDGAVVARLSKDSFGFAAVLTLEDGRRIDMTVRARLKRDAVARFAAMPETPINMQACFHEGRFVGTSATYRLGGRGLEAEEV
jgi:hypothetical protein